MANENRYYKTPFAESGTKAEVPDVSVGGAVGYDTGFGPDYGLPKDDIDRKNVERNYFNGLNNSITKNLKQWQEGLYPTWIENDGDGAVFLYPIDMIVAHNGGNWRSLVTDNQEEPGTGGQWSSSIAVNTTSDNTYDAGTTQTFYALISDTAIVGGASVKDTMDANALAASSAQASADSAQASADANTALILPKNEYFNQEGVGASHTFSATTDALQYRVTITCAVEKNGITPALSVNLTSSAAMTDIYMNSCADTISISPGEWVDFTATPTRRFWQSSSDVSIYNSDDIGADRAITATIILTKAAAATLVLTVVSDGGLSYLETTVLFEPLTTA